MPVPHGTGSGYTDHRCRCDKCRAWSAAYKRAWRAANPDVYRKHRQASAQRDKESPRPCRIDGCHNNAQVHGTLCGGHQTRVTRTGSTGSATVPKQWLGERVGYKGLHNRLRAARGLARDNTCECGRPAAEWSMRADAPDQRQGGVTPGGKKHGLYSLDLTAYDPRCYSCHKRYDSAARGAALGPPLREQGDLIEQDRST